MKKIDWENPKKKSEAYTHLMQAFKVSRPTVSLAMSFKRDSLKAAQMRYVAVQELGGRQMSDDNVPVATVKVLDAKGNVKAVLKNDVVTL